MDRDTKKIILSDILLLLVFFMTYYFYYRPELQQQQEQLELLKKQVEAQTQLQVFPLPSSGWRTIDSMACAKIYRNSTLTFQIVNTVGKPVQIITIVYDSTDWSNRNLGPVLSSPNERLMPGKNMTNEFDFGNYPQNYGTQGQQTTFSITIVTVELSAQTNTYCIVYS